MHGAGVDQCVRTVALAVGDDGIVALIGLAFAGLHFFEGVDRDHGNNRIGAGEFLIGDFHDLLDEIFDGLDPVMRLLLKKLIIEQVSDSAMTVIIASHNLRELEDLCDRVCLMHLGRMLLDRDIDTLREEFRKVQIAFQQIPLVPNLFEGINIVNAWQNGNIFNLTIRGKETDFMPQLEALKPAYISAMPLSLEEIFISEMGVYGYDTGFVL